MNLIICSGLITPLLNNKTNKITYILSRKALFHNHMNENHGYIVDFLRLETTYL